MKWASLSALRTGRCKRQGTTLVLVSVRGWDDPRIIVRQEGLSQWKIPMIPTGIEPANHPACSAVGGNSGLRISLTFQSVAVNDDQQDAAILRHIYLFLISCTCFERSFRPSSGVLDCIYSIFHKCCCWLVSSMTPAGGNIGVQYQRL